MWRRRGSRFRSRLLIAVLASAVLAGAAALAQSRGRQPFSAGRAAPRGNVPDWTLDHRFERDCFTFARLKWSSRTGRRSQTWETDYPDSDLNMSWRLHQLTAMKVHPQGVVIEITDPELFNYPFLFMSGVGGLRLEREEVPILRRYLLSGGFILADDFWGEEEWENFHGEMKRVFPEREPEDLPVTHEIFNGLFKLNEKPQIPNVYHALRNRDTGITWERPDARTPNYRAIKDDKGRIMVLICHNTDLGDGWEEEGTDPYYFAEFSEKKAYPLGINIILYALTH